MTPSPRIAVQARYSYAFSLVEAMVAVFILSMTLGALACALVMMTSGSVSGLMRNVAYNASQMYLGQILAMYTAIFDQVYASPENTPFPTVSIQLDTQGNQYIEGDPIYVNQLDKFLNQPGQTVDLKDNTNNKAYPFWRKRLPNGQLQLDTIQINYDVYLTNLNQAQQSVDAYLVGLSFNYTVTYLNGQADFLSGKVYGIKRRD